MLVIGRICVVSVRLEFVGAHICRFKHTLIDVERLGKLIVKGKVMCFAKVQLNAHLITVVTVNRATSGNR